MSALQYHKKIGKYCNTTKNSANTTFASHSGFDATRAKMSKKWSCRNNDNFSLVVKTITL